MKIIWTLRYDRSITAFLMSVRGTAKCEQIHNAIKALQYKDDPTEGCIAVQGRADRYEFEEAGHWIGIEIVINDKAVRVLYITLDL